MDGINLEEKDITKKDGGLNHGEEYVVARALENYTTEIEIQGDNIEMSLDDIEFIHADDQWSEPVKAERKKGGKNRPCVTINRTEAAMRIIEGDILQNEVSASIAPVDMKNDPEIAEQCDALLKHIHVDSDADMVYGKMAIQAIEGGFGYVRVRTKYRDNSFDKEFVIEGFEDISSVLLDSHYERIDATDRNYGFVLSYMSRKEFKKQYPDAKLSGFVKDGWVTGKDVRIAEYYERECKYKTVYLDKHGASTTEDDVPDDENERKKFMALQVDEREQEYYEVYWYKITSSEILEGPIKISEKSGIIPIFESNGIVVRTKDGIRQRKGMFHNSRTPQDFINAWATAQAEYLQSSNKAKYIGTKMMFADNMSDWRDANVNNKAVLTFSRDPEFPGDKPIPVPPPQISTGFANARKEANEDFYFTSLMSESYLGGRGNETSGKAKLLTLRRSDISTYLFHKHSKDTITTLNYYILQELPSVYTYKDILRVTGEDGNSKDVKINPIDENTGEDRVMVEDAYKFDLVVNIGPSFSTQRQENVDTLTNAIQYSGDPLDKKVIMIGAFENSDSFAIQKIAAKLKKTLPPELQDNEEVVAAANQSAQQQQQIQMKEIELKFKGMELDNQNKSIQNEKDVSEIKNMQVENKQMLVTLEQMLSGLIKAQFTEVAKT